MHPKNAVLGAIAAVSLLSGAIDQYFYPGQMWPPTSVGATLVLTFLVFLWYRLDSNQFGYRRSPWLNIGVIAVAIAALPYYFFRSRGFARGAMATGVMVLAVIGSLMLSAIGVYAVYFGQVR